jgi:hypothetical protein
VSNVVTVPRAKWSVIWVSNEGEIKRIRCDEDMAHAQELFGKAARQGKRAATLHSDNVGFAPPDKFADVETIPIGRSKRTKKIVYRTEVIEPRQFNVKMLKLNRRGIWWCPYCIRLRKFKLQRRAEVDGIKCPLCKISHRDGNVRRYNPIAQQLALRQGRSNRNRRRRRSE